MKEMKVLKYPVPVTDDFELVLPAGSQILSVQVQGIYGDRPFLWALVDTGEGQNVTRTFRLLGTGHVLEDHHKHQYIGTFQCDDGHFVGHLFERVIP